MDDLNRLIAEYKVAFQSGEGDPRPFLERAAPADRALLAALIDAFLEEAPRQASAGHEAAARVTDEVHRTLAGTSGLWPALLPRLRGRARLRRGGGVVLRAVRAVGRERTEEVRGRDQQIQ